MEDVTMRIGDLAMINKQTQDRIETYQNESFACIGNLTDKLVVMSKRSAAAICPLPC